MELRFDESSVREWTPDGMPEGVRLQILAFMRQAWPAGFRGGDFLRDWISAAQDDPVHVVALLPNGCVAAHAAAVHRTFDAFGRKLEIGGLTGVFSFEQVRGLGWGKGVAARATAVLERLPLDAGLFCCEPETADFYRKAGWEVLPGHPLTVGPEKRVEESAALFRAFSPAGRELRARLAEDRLHFGDYVW